MAEPVHLPNAVSCSDQRKTMQPVLGQSKRITAEYKGVKTATTRRSTSSTFEQVGIKNVDHVVVGAENGTTLKILKMICIGVALSTVISTATFGGIIFNLTKRIENNEREYETMRSDMATLQIQASKESQNSTNGNWKSSTNLSISELEQIKDRIDTLESVADIHASALSHLETGASVLEHRIEKATENLTSQDVTITALNDSIMQLKVLTNDLSNSSETGGKTLSQLEADMNSFEAMRQELYSSVIEFEANITADRAFKLRLMTVIANMEANLTSATQMIKTQGDTIQAINETVVQMGTVTSRANSSSLIDTDILLADLEAELESRLLQIELDVAKEKSKNLSSNLTDLELEIGILKIKNQDHHDILSKNSDRIGLLNENIMAYFDIAHNLSSNVTTLEMQIGTINEAIQNKHGEIIDNSGRIRLLNETVTAILGNAQNFESNIADLERDIGTVKIAIQNNNNEIASSFADIEDLNKSTSDSLSQLATRLTEETALPKPSSYAFSAYWLADKVLSSWEIPVFSKTIFDEAHAYDNSSGKFTVNQNGVYLFTARFCLGSGHYLGVNIVADGERFGGFDAGDDMFSTCSSGTAIEKLKEGTKVWMEVDNGATCVNDEAPSGFNYFAGLLIN